MYKARLLKREDGFSLLELLMVIMIIGILVSIAVLSFAFSMSASKKTVCKANLKIIREQVTVYYSEYDSFPPSLQNLVPDFIERDKSIYCPDSGEAYVYDPGTGEVSCPYHVGI